MTDGSADPQSRGGAETNRLDGLLSALGEHSASAPAPVHQWHPPFGGDIDLRIAFDGTWSYGGSPIDRRAMVELFARILRRDGERYVLVTPVECVGITVDDVPFIAAAMAQEGDVLRFRTNVGDVVEVGEQHPLRFETDSSGGIRPYVLVRDALWARLSRSLAVELLSLAVPSGDGNGDGDGDGLGIRAGGCFFRLGVAA